MSGSLHEAALSAVGQTVRGKTKCTHEKVLFKNVKVLEFRSGFLEPSA